MTKDKVNGEDERHRGRRTKLIKYEGRADKRRNTKGTRLIKNEVKKEGKKKEELEVGRRVNGQNGQKD